MIPVGIWWKGNTAPGKFSLELVQDLLLGGSFAETLNGKDGNDTILGQGGDDTIIASEGDDVIDGGAGVDLVDYSAFSDNILVDNNGNIKDTTCERSNIGYSYVDKSSNNDIVFIAC